MDIDDRVRAAIERADQAFWAQIAEAFPEAQYGDFAPDQTMAWEDARDRAVRGWVANNVPGAEA